MGVTLASTLQSIGPQVFTDIFYQGLLTKPIVQNLATYHDLSGATSTAVNFPSVQAVGATKTADGSATSFTTLGVEDATASLYEIQAAVEITRFAQATSQISNPMQIVQSLMAALSNQVETDLLVQATSSGPADVIGDGTGALTLANIRSARAVLGGWVNDFLAGWVLNPTGEANLITDANISQAQQYSLGVPTVLQDGRITTLYGAPTFLTPFAPAGYSAMIAKGTLHYGVAQPPTIDVIWSADDRSDKVVATAVVAVKYVAQSYIKGAALHHT